MGQIILGDANDDKEFLWQGETKDQVNIMFTEIYQRIIALSPEGIELVQDNT